ncbi:acyl-CoA thioester hydrolase/BAAT C-terminal domain-containing protein [Flexivirga meconopsidis]|uniref:acyl-CoA thioester hydrolase/BAAT C-terminal domain-containing protein n=1 Tax=Flexivirga meconopsidis TaxID=2977121 RepID=UPI00223FE7D0|nr:acyl-CoA thioester hydrolase/BAAT C-terminal domain-containing protein [Flexivirga meconopsidis]
MEEQLTHPDGVLVSPERHCGTGVLTLGGSSGRIDDGRARLFAAHGALALSIRWFGGDGQPSGPRLIPLETFTAALDRLAPHCDRLVIAGTSFGAEAALLTGAYDERASAAIGFAPSNVVWSFIDPDGTQVSHWSWAGEPMPAVPYDTAWKPDTDPPAFVGNYRQSLAAADPKTVAAATIPVDHIDEVLLVAGGDDQVWPAADFASAIADRRRAHGRDTTVVTRGDAGHRTILPGESAVSGGMHMQRGGTEQADRALGEQAWPAVRDILRLPSAG